VNRPTRDTAAGRAYLDLQNKAHRERRPTDELFQLYALEGFVARLAGSSHRAKLVLKGGVLLAAFGTRRPTRDVDFQATDLSNDADTVLTLVRDIAKVHLEDGLEFDADDATAVVIRDEDEYSGVRVTLGGRLSQARIRFHVDVNVGDPVWPEPQEVHLPRLLGGDTIDLAGYPLHMVHAEKMVTAIQRGTANTRWRDFGDIWSLSRQHAIAGADLQGGLTEVARYRSTELDRFEVVLAGFAELAQGRWQTWRRRRGMEHLPESFDTVLLWVTNFADPAIKGQVSNLSWRPDDGVWS
jgi:Nucleotidyl transferase AbiEii toxin, Type IV TA system